MCDDAKEAPSADTSIVITDHRAASSRVPIPTASSDPMDMIAVAVQRDLPIEKLERLMDLQERWEANESRKAFTVAMSKFKGLCPPTMPKDGKVSHKGGKYNHTTLGTILEVVTGHLSACGLSVAWETCQEKGHITVTCSVTHIAGHLHKVALTAPYDTSGSKNAIQSIGSAVTYLQRYTAIAALGLAACTEDDDGNASHERRPRQQQSRRDDGDPRPPEQREEKPQSSADEFTEYEGGPSAKVFRRLSEYCQLDALRKEWPRMKWFRDKALAGEADGKACGAELGRVKALLKKRAETKGADHIAAAKEKQKKDAANSELWAKLAGLLRNESVSNKTKAEIKHLYKRFQNNDEPAAVDLLDAIAAGIEDIRQAAEPGEPPEPDDDATSIRKLQSLATHKLCDKSMKDAIHVLIDTHQAGKLPAGEAQALVVEIEGHLARMAEQDDAAGDR